MKMGQAALIGAIAVLVTAGSIGCQTAGSRVPALGLWNSNAPAKTVSHTETTQDRLEKSYYASEEAKRLEGTSISHYRPGREAPKRVANSQAGPGGRPQPGGSGSRNY